jgi:hypothetical protein
VPAYGALDVAVLIAKLGAETTVPALGERMRCTKCGGRESRQFGVEVDELRDAVRKVGSDPRAVWRELVGQVARRPKATSRVKRRREGNARRGLDE